MRIGRWESSGVRRVSRPGSTPSPRGSASTVWPQASHGSRATAPTRWRICLAEKGTSPATTWSAASARAALHRAIGELPEDRRIVVMLRDLEGLSYEEIAAALGLELGTVRSRLHRARVELKEKLERYLT